MADSFAWTCPYCQRVTTIVDANYSEKTHFFQNGNKDGQLGLVTYVIVCPNPTCKEYEIGCLLYKASRNRVSGAFEIYEPQLLLRLPIKPTSFAKVFPDYIPVQIRNDYTEACKIRDLSPKASATLSRRCMQGMIRDFWKIQKANLKLEIDELNSKVDPLTWSAIDSVRQIGNIGAHMERDIDLIIDIDPNEADLLIGLIENLIKDWYITRTQREQQLLELKKLAEDKKDAKQDM